MDNQTEQYSCFMQPDANRAIDVIRYGVITVMPQTRLYQALACIVDLNISGLPVVNEETQLEGILTEKDLLALLYKKQSTSGLVESHMNREVISFDAESSLEEICECLLNHPFRRVPITQNGKVISVISRRDLLRVNLHKFVIPEAKPQSFRPAGPFPAWHVMKRKLFTVRPDSLVPEAMAIMSDYALSGLPVVEEGMRLVGIITEKDVMPYFYGSQQPPETVGELMTSDVTAFGPEDNVIDICECLIDNQFRRVPIVKNGALMGLISRADVIRYILRNIARVSQFRAAQIVSQMIR